MATTVPNQANAAHPRARSREEALAFTYRSSVSSMALKPEIKSVERYFGGNSYSADAKAREKIQGTIDQACQIVSPLIAFTLMPIQFANPDGTVYLADGQTLPLPDCACGPCASFLAAAIGTLGIELETQCRLLAAQHHIYQSTLLDAVGNAMLDAMDIKIRSLIDTESRNRGLFRGVRFAPGLNEYPLDHQQTLFQAVDGVSLGVRLNAFHMMEPVKTISFFSLIGCEKVENRHPDKCLRCQLPHCQFRKGPFPSPGTGSGKDRV